MVMKDEYILHPLSNVKCFVQSFNFQADREQLSSEQSEPVIVSGCGEWRNVERCFIMIAEE